MPSPRTGSYATTSGPIMAESATLPVLRAAGFEVRVNAYVVGRTRRIAPLPMPQNNVQSHLASPSVSPERDRSPGCQGGVTDLWYLSLVGARGQGTSLRAVWANLVSNRSHSVWLEGVGSVALGHSRLDLAGLGYPIHWTYRQAVIPPSRDVQALLESDVLTCHDPLLVPRSHPHQSRSRSRRPVAGTAKGPGQATSTRGSAAGNKTDGGAVTLTSAASAADGADEAAAREARPIFLLLVPTIRSLSRTESSVSDSLKRTDEQARDEWLARLHLRYLAARIPWLPYYPVWAAYLWQRARERGEVEALHVWCYGGREPERAHVGAGETGEDPPSAQDTDAANRPGSYLAAAFLCRPDPLALTADLSRAIARGSFHTPAPPASPARPVEPLAA